MKLHWLACAALTATLGAGCSDTGEQFVILQNQVPSPGCRVGTERGVYRGEGWLDVSLVAADAPFAYQLFPLLQNDLPSAGTMGGGGEPNRLFVRAFRVRIEAPEGVPDKVAKLFDNVRSSNPDLLEYQERWAGSVDPGGLLVGTVAGMPGELARRIRATGALDGLSFMNLVLHVRAVADRSIGSVESKEFTYPLKVCSRCLVATLKPCPFAPTNKGNACNVAQDEPVDCCTAGTTLVCPSAEDI